MTTFLARSPRARRWRITAAATTAVGAVIGAAFAGATPAQASSHREAPLIAGDPRVDNTDVYAFVSPDAPDSVNLIANWIPFEEPNGGPNFYPFEDGSHYDINIDNNGNALPDIIYRWTFTSVDKRGTDTFLYNNGPVTSLKDKNLLFKQKYTVTRIADGQHKVIAKGTVAPSNVGKASMPNYATLRTQAISKVKGGGQAFAGQADDPFFLDLRVFDLLYGGNLSETGQDTLKGYNVNSVALQIPKADLTLNHKPVKNPVVGIWSSTSKQSVQLGGGTAKPFGHFSQVSRLGNPLVNEVVLPAGLKDAFNSLTPDKDATIPAVVKRVTDPELPKLIESIYGIPAPATPRNDLVEIYLTGIAKQAPTLDGSQPPIQADLNSQVLNQDVNPSNFRPSEMLRLNTAVPPSENPNRLGVLGGDLQGFPNGRRLADDVVDISIQAVEGAAVSGIVPALAAGDKVDQNDNAFGTSFPYVALPNTAAVNQATGGQAAASATKSGAALGTGDGTSGSQLLGTQLISARVGVGSMSMPFLGVVGLSAAFLGSGLFVALRRRRHILGSHNRGSNGPVSLPA
ncbi:MAG TPA: DUF4331 domain-containing protein [Kineosporiaceae bacterium]|nr:DUF4331 domain-containing protein [Kineosporiaceae bacterium]